MQPGGGEGCAFTFAAAGFADVSRYTGRKVLRRAVLRRSTVLTRLKQADRSSLLVTTALASTLIIGALLPPTHALAQTTTCTGGPGPGPTPILEATAAPIICVNTDDRTSNGTSPDAINLSTTGSGNYITLYNSGLLSAATSGIYALTSGNAIGSYSDSGIEIDNAGDINAGSLGIFVQTSGNANGNYSNTGIDIANAGDINAGFNGIDAVTSGDANGAYSNSGVVIGNTGDIGVNGYVGIAARTYGSANGANSDAGIGIDNRALSMPHTARASLPRPRNGVGAFSNSGIDIDNSGDITSGGTVGNGILAGAYGNAVGALQQRRYRNHQFG